MHSRVDAGQRGALPELDVGAVSRCHDADDQRVDRRLSRIFAFPAVGKPYTFNADTLAARQPCVFRYAFSFYVNLQPFESNDHCVFRGALADQRTTLPLFQAEVALPRQFARW
jgi:hypothetical protein